MLKKYLTIRNVYVILLLSKGAERKVIDMIYSEYLEMMIPKGFTIKRCYIDITGTKPYYITGCNHYTWNEDDLVYYNDDVDEDFYYDIPCNGFKSLSFLSGYRRMRYLIIKDK